MTSTVRMWLLVLSVVLMGTLGLVVLAYVQGVNEGAAIQHSRSEAYLDTCRALRGVIQHAYAPMPRQRLTLYAMRPGKDSHFKLLVVVPSQAGHAAKVIAADGLANCAARARQLIR